MAVMGFPLAEAGSLLLDGEAVQGGHQPDGPVSAFGLPEEFADCRQDMRWHSTHRQTQQDEPRHNHEAIVLE